MDVLVIFFDSNKQVVRSFIGSHFMGRASAEDTFASLKEVHKDLDLVGNIELLLQIYSEKNFLQSLPFCFLSIRSTII